MDTTTILTEGRSLEWLETDGLGGFASGTVSGLRTRRYHSLLTAATLPPAGRMVLVNGVNAWLETDAGSFPLTSQLYGPDYVAPDAQSRITSFTTDPWPQWKLRISDSLSIVHELFMVHGSSAIVLSWRLDGVPPAQARLGVRPFFSGRDFHTLHHENSQFQFEPKRVENSYCWKFYPSVPSLTVRTNGTYTHDPHWYRNFLYTEEQARGLDAIEELAAPGAFDFDLTTGPAVLIFSVDAFAPRLQECRDAAESLHREFANIERERRSAFVSPLHRAADAYLVDRGAGKTILAGYPWFGDWGRDTFIALRGLCLAAGRLNEAHAILTEWAGAISEGMLPNRFPDRGEQPEYNSVDASLWYIVAIHDFFESVLASGQNGLLENSATLLGAIESILGAYESGTRYGIRMDEDGLLACGAPGVQLTWMDAKVGEWVVTPRIGKPVEVQALWVNALWIGARHNPRWQSTLDRALASFRERFWNESRRCLFDVIDCNHHAGENDASLRPNQILAVGGLPLTVLDADRAAVVVQTVEETLWTPLGLRSLAPGELNYAPHYEGNVLHRDGSYHQGTVWPWLAGPFIEAWVRVRGGSLGVKAEAHARFVQPLLDHLDHAGLGHVSEIADGDAPHLPRGCPFQAWSLSELLRLRDAVTRAG